MLALAVAITAATDEGGLSWSERVARAVPVVPVCGALATALALGGRDRRGEGRALEALGRSAFANGVAAATGAAAVGLVIALIVLLDANVSVAPFFPTVHGPAPYVFEDGGFSNAATGWRVMQDGTLVLPPPDALASARDALRAHLEATGLPPHGRVAAALLTLLGSAGFALTVALVPRARHGTTALVLLGVAAASAFCLQAAAAGRIPLIVVLFPSTMLLLGAAWAIVRPRWQPPMRAG